MPKPIFVLNGPNLNMLGLREPEIYGSVTLDDVRARIEAYGKAKNVDIDFRQSNHEGDLIDWLHEARESASAVILNAGALTHTSIGLLDAMKSAATPVVEVHLSNIFARESFRHHSFVSMAAVGVICGFGAKGYEMAIDALLERGATAG
ncbi:MAG: type II 3-dehydroquinate dehydratase [Hyphomicrobiaceae bacterium]